MSKSIKIILALGFVAFLGACSTTQAVVEDVVAEPVLSKY
jgi:hypothetical protein|tara:strand:- start:2043 stop:2162 length:120 start_codon:yes stop_codon:yes gene_type:complete